MKATRLAAALFLMCVASQAQTTKNPSAPIGELFIGRHTFIDVGPPNDFYEVLAVRPESSGSSVERITFTPPGDACLHPATIEIATGSLNESIPELLEGVNPCRIPERTLEDERKRGTRGPVFSGADVSLEALCGGKVRLIRTDIAEQDWFDSHPQTPRYTSWTMRLLSRLDAATGPSVLDRPIFADFPPNKMTSQAGEDPLLIEAKDGKLDDLFPNASDRISELYRLAQIPPAVPSAKLVSSTTTPTIWTDPNYPPIAKAARVEGTVVVDLRVGSRGMVSDIIFKTGPPMLRGAVEDAAKKWKFPVEAGDEQLEVNIKFSLNCPSSEKR